EVGVQREVGVDDRVPRFVQVAGDQSQVVGADPAGILWHVDSYPFVVCWGSNQLGRQFTRTCAAPCRAPPSPVPRFNSLTAIVPLSSGNDPAKCHENRSAVWLTENVPTTRPSVLLRSTW